MNNDDNIIMRRICSHARTVCRRSDRLPGGLNVPAGIEIETFCKVIVIKERAGCSSVGATLSGYKVSGVESRHAIKQMVDSRKGATCEMSVAGLALPVVQQSAAAVTRGEKMERLIGGNSDPLAREPDKKRRLVMPPRRSSARPHFVNTERGSA